MESFNLSLTYQQILDLVRQLPKKDKLKLSKELSSELVDAQLSLLLEAFETEELDEATILEEVEFVRSQNYDKKTAK